MSNITTQTNSALALSDDELIDVLCTSLYPGAQRQSIKLAISYCRAAGLDPMQKPVHIVPMWDGKAKQMRDVIMPGVGLYRTQAARTNTFAGQTEPEFGPMITSILGGVEITHPEWARVTVKKTMPNNSVAEFSAVEFWIENYAVKGGVDKSIAPNSMWTKRPRGQIAKCAAAQALRLAFPEAGAQPTFEEMEGKTFFEDDSVLPTPAEIAPKTLPAYPAESFKNNLPAWRKLIESGGKTAENIIQMVETKGTLTEEQMTQIRAIKSNVIDMEPA